LGSWKDFEISIYTSSQRFFGNKTIDLGELSKVYDFGLMGYSKENIFKEKVIFKDCIFKGNLLLGKLSLQKKDFFSDNGAEFNNCVFDDGVRFVEIKNRNISFINSNLKKLSFFAGDNLEFINFVDSEILSYCQNDGEYKIYDEKRLKGFNEIASFRSLEKIYLKLQKNFAKNGEIAESVKYAKGKLRVAKERIKFEFDKRKKGLEEENKELKKEKKEY